MKGLRCAARGIKQDSAVAGLATALWGAMLLSRLAMADGAHPTSDLESQSKPVTDARAARLRCTKLADVSACDDALRAQPDDPQLTVARGDALLQVGRAADAMIAYRHAQDLQPAQESIKTRLAAAESQRQSLVTVCEGSADAAAVDACQAALLHGTADEFVLLKRKGTLLQSMDRSEPALDAFIAAEVIKQDDQTVALAIVALTDSTRRKDALALAARGSALLALNRPTEALQALQQAQALGPALPGIKLQLARAAQASRLETRRKARRAPRKTRPGERPFPDRVPQGGRSTTFYMFGAQGNQLRTVDFAHGLSDGRFAAGTIDRHFGQGTCVRVRADALRGAGDAVVELAHALAG